MCSLLLPPSIPCCQCARVSTRPWRTIGVGASVSSSAKRMARPSPRIVAGIKADHLCEALSTVIVPEPASRKRGHVLAERAGLLSASITSRALAGSAPADSRASHLATPSLRGRKYATPGTRRKVLEQVSSWPQVYIVELGFAPTVLFEGEASR